jgi:hypothetical protein
MCIYELSHVYILITISYIYYYSIISEYTAAHGISLATPRDTSAVGGEKSVPNSARSTGSQVRKSSRAEGKGL